MRDCSYCGVYVENEFNVPIALSAFRDKNGVRSSALTGVNQLTCVLLTFR